MSDATPTQPPQRCEPGEADRRRDGYHWVDELWDDGEWHPIVLQWWKVGCWRFPLFPKPEHLASLGYRYRGPVPTQTQKEVDALVEAAAKRAAQFQAYADEHRAQGKHDKAIRNQEAADDLTTALAPFQNRGENSDAE